MLRLREHDLLNIAADLLSEDDHLRHAGDPATVHYDRAIVELTTRLLGHSDQAQPQVEQALRGLAAIQRLPKEAP